MNAVKLGIIGLGYVGQIHLKHAKNFPALKSLP